MPNNILPVEEVKKRIRFGYPEGVDNLSAKQIPQLLTRIQELERAIEPFARASVANEAYPTELVQVYLRDCDLAREQLDPSRSVPANKVDDFFNIPAE